MLVIGLMSGTSADGVDAALVDINETKGRKNLKLIAFKIFPFSGVVRKSIMEACSPEFSSVDKICLLNVRLGDIFARAAMRIVADARVPIKDIKLIGSHGQTICHLPRRHCTLQIGEPSIIAERTGVMTIADFRPRDVAAGGHGAPLTPYLHYYLFHKTRIARAIQNIGGISNVTVLPPGEGLEKVFAFDTGPGNMVIDGLMGKGTGAKWDKSGRTARDGKIDNKLLSLLLSHPYLKKRPPKTTGREEFGTKLVERIWQEGKRRHLCLNDLVATATAFTAHTISDAYRNFILPRWRVSEIVFGGGGVRNTTLMKYLRELFPEVRLSTFEDYGLNSDAVEAMAFAFLAYEAYKGRSNNIPSATGAGRSVVMGKILPGYPR